MNESFLVNNNGWRIAVEKFILFETVQVDRSPLKIVKPVNTVLNELHVSHSNG
jgi:hypothetical protein